MSRYPKPEIRTHEQQPPPPPVPNGNGAVQPGALSENDIRADGTLLPALPENRAKVIEYGLLTFQQMAAERDQFERQVNDLKIDIAAHKVEQEAMQSRIADLESRAATAMLVRDQAVADRAVYETLFALFKAQLRAFNIPAVPLVKEAESVADV